MKKIFLLIISLGLFAFVLISSPSPAQTYDPNNTKQNVKIKKGNSFQVVLDSNPTTGYQWMYLMDPQEEKVKLVKSSYIINPSNPKMVGVGGKETLIFKAMKTGETRIILEYVRSFEPKKPAKIHTLDIAISL